MTPATKLKLIHRNSFDGFTSMPVKEPIRGPGALGPKAFREV
jgi:hypothetical protein